MKTDNTHATAPSYQNFINENQTNRLVGDTTVALRFIFGLEDSQKKEIKNKIEKGWESMRSAVKTGWDYFYNLVFPKSEQTVSSQNQTTEEKTEKKVEETEQSSKSNKSSESSFVSLGSDSLKITNDKDRIIEEKSPPDHNSGDKDLKEINPPSGEITTPKENRPSDIDSDGPQPEANASSSSDQVTSKNPEEILKEMHGFNDQVNSDKAKTLGFDIADALDYWDKGISSGHWLMYYDKAKNTAYLFRYEERENAHWAMEKISKALNLDLNCIATKNIKIKRLIDNSLKIDPTPRNQSNAHSSPEILNRTPDWLGVITSVKRIYS